MSCYVYDDNGETKKITVKEWQDMVKIEEQDTCMKKQYYIYDKNGYCKTVTKEEADIHKKALVSQKEETTQQHIKFEDVEEVNGKKYPILMMSSGLYKYKGEMPYDNPNVIKTYTYDPIIPAKKPTIIKIRDPFFAVKIRAK
jgi:hypothetical protein